MKTENTTMQPNLELISAVLLRLPGFDDYIHHSGTESRGPSVCNVTQQLLPESGADRGTMALIVEAKCAFDVEARTRVWMCVASRVVQPTLPV